MSSPGPILVVDDDPSIREMLVLILETRGFDVRQAADGMKALERARAEPPSLILLDLMMPGMDGVAMVEELHRDPELARIPIVVLSGDSTACDRTAPLQIHRCLIKPIELDELVELAEQYVAA